MRNVCWTEKKNNKKSPLTRVEFILIVPAIGEYSYEYYVCNINAVKKKNKEHNLGPKGEGVTVSFTPPFNPSLHRTRQPLDPERNDVGTCPERMLIDDKQQVSGVYRKQSTRIRFAAR